MFISRLLFISTLLLLNACNDDLFPSSTDERTVIEQGVSGTQVGQLSPDFTVRSSLDVDVTLSDNYASTDAAVLYFTMWCPICDSHMSYLRSQVVPYFNNVQFYFIDYVSGSVTASRSAQLANGYTDFTVLVDDEHSLLNLYQATMATTVIIDNTGTVQMNEDFKDGSKLIELLASLP